MTALSELSDGHILLLAVQSCINGDIAALPRLQSHFHGTPSADIFFRIILTFLPESTEPAQYIPVLESLASGSVPESTDEDVGIDTTTVGELTASAARKQVQKLHLLPLRYPGHAEDESASPLVQFLIHRAHRIDSESGLQPFILELLQPFIHTSTYLQTWVISTALPLLRFNYEYHCENDVALSLEIIQSLDSGSAVNILLSKTDRRDRGGDVGRDLRGLVGPWMYGNARSKRRKLNRLERSGSISIFDDQKDPSARTRCSGWQDVNEWLLSTSIRDFPLAVEAVEQWSGPQDIDLGGYNDQGTSTPVEDGEQIAFSYGQAALAAIYATTEATPETLDGSCRILSRIASLLEIDGHSVLRIYENGLEPLNLDLTPLSDISRGAILQNALLERSNPLTFPTTQSISFIDAILVSIRTLASFGHTISCRAATDISLLASDEMQLSELSNVFESLQQEHKNGRDWRKTRLQLLWLRDWGYSDSLGNDIKPRAGHGLFWRVPLALLERDILKALLNARQYTLAVELYASPPSRSPLPQDQVESAVTESIFASYDNATNGNKTRGGIKRASEMLESFGPHFPHSESFRQIKALITATHSLSFYSLTLQHGVPFQPVSIRVHPDPLSLIGKVLEQNSKAYTELDNLLSIGRQLVAAGFPASPKYRSEPTHAKQSPSQEEEALAADHRIIYLAISAALEADDFGTAYSYVTTRLSPPSIIPSTSQGTKFPTSKDDVSWRAAYNAGCHRPAFAESPNAPLQSQIHRLSQRMELLSLALVLTPSPDNLHEILAVWRRCDEEMTSLHARESKEAENWDARGDNMTSSATLPGGFGPSDAELDALETERAKQSRRTGNAGRGSRLTSGYEEAPMGLFDVARGAAKAISKTAFPLRGPEALSGNNATSTFGGGDSDSSRRVSMDTAGEEDGGRVRKRDVVSNMVTGGLASGIGWVLGAQPVNNHNNNDGNAG
ncbi:hypothetical protein FQN51_005541 [Onygenales sp. PD_10]|nr:hypothetical protein FQN51_005541 [Onygenales sp. PD_10]